MSNEELYNAIHNFQIEVMSHKINMKVQVRLREIFSGVLIVTRMNFKY